MLENNGPLYSHGKTNIWKIKKTSNNKLIYKLRTSDKFTITTQNLIQLQVKRAISL